MNKYRGIIFALIAGVFSGLAIGYAKISVMNIDPLVLTSARNTVAFLILFTIWVNFGNSKKNIGIIIPQLPKLIVLGMLGGSIPFILFFFGLSKIGALEANIIQKSLFLWTTVIGFLFFRSSTKIHKTHLFIWGFLLFGTYLLSGIKLSLSYGLLLVLFATIFWATESLLVHRWKSLDSSFMAIGRMGFGLIILWLIVAASGKISILYSLSFEQIRFIIIGGTLLSGYVFCFYRALRYSPAHIVVSFLTISTVIGWFVSFIHTPVLISPKEIISYISILVGIGILIIISSNFNRINLDESS